MTHEFDRVQDARARAAQALEAVQWALKDPTVAALDVRYELDDAVGVLESIELILRDRAVGLAMHEGAYL